MTKKDKSADYDQDSLDEHCLGSHKLGSTGVDRKLTFVQ
jgi:hypothetical protein